MYVLLVSYQRLGHGSDTHSDGPGRVTFQFDHLIGAEKSDTSSKENKQN